MATAIGIAIAACSSDNGASSNHIAMTKYAGDEQTVIETTPVPVLPAVQLTRNGQPIAGDTVVFATADTLVSPGIVTDSVQVTNSDGIATVGGWVPGLTGGHNMTATLAEDTTVWVTFTAISSSYPLFVDAIGGSPSAPAGTALAVPPAVIVHLGTSTLAGDTVTFKVTSGGGSITGAVVITDSTGHASLGSWTLGPTPGLNSVTVTASPFTNVQATFYATGTE